MPEFDDSPPEEREPGVRQLTSLLTYIYQQPAAIEAISDKEQKRILARARTRLHTYAASTAVSEQRAAHLSLVPLDPAEQEVQDKPLPGADEPVGPQTRPQTFLQGDQNALRPARDPGKRRRVASFAQMLAAVLIVGVLVGGLGLLFTSQRNFLPGNSVPSKWCQPPVPGLNSASSLESIAALSSSDVWAVGYSGDSSGNKNKSLIEHWDGHAWSIVRSPNLGTGDNFLSTVLAFSPTDIWAAGQAFAPGQQHTTMVLIEHWDGHAWSIVNAPNPASGGINRLFSLSAVSPTDIWGVGSTIPIATDLSGKPNRTLIEHWNGRNWQVMPSPNPGSLGSVLNSVVALSANDVWAVGESVQGSLSLVEHWDGQSWKVVATPAPTPRASNAQGASFQAVDSQELSSVTATSANDVWAVGGGDAHTLVEHWDGRAWSIVPSPEVVKSTSQGQVQLTGVMALAQNNVWAVGNVAGLGQTTEEVLRNSRSLVEHWNGQTWQVISTFRPAAQLSSITATPEGQIWMSGSPYSNTNAPYVAYSC